MAVMVNSMGGSGDYRGPIYVREIAVPNFVAGEFCEIVNLQGPGRLIQAIGTRANSSGYNESSDAIRFQIIPDGDMTKALYKAWYNDSCSVTNHLPVDALMASMGFPEIGYSGEMVVIPNHYLLGYSAVAADRIVGASTTWHGASSHSGIQYSFPGNAEGLGESAKDQTLTIYQDGMFFDDSLVINGRWGQIPSGTNANFSFNGVIIVYQLFE